MWPVTVMIANFLNNMLGAVFITVLLLLPFVPPLLCWRAYRNGKNILALLIAVATLAVWLLYFPYLPTGDNRVAELTTADGWGFEVFQKCNHSAEPYTTSFYYRTAPTNRWHAFYMDHQDERWWSGRIAYDESSKCAQVFRGRKMVASFSLERLEFTRNKFATTNSWILGEGESPGSEGNR